MNESNYNLLKGYLTAYFLYGDEDPEALIKWLLDDKHPGKIEYRESLKRALREALDMPGAVTPFVFEQWTHNCEIDTQEQVQKILQKLWDACFEGKVIEDWELYAEDEVPQDHAEDET